MSGAIFETYVVSEIIKSYWQNAIEPPIYFYRDRDKKEIDLLIENNETLYPVEIKKTATPGKSNISAFHTLKKLELPLGRGAIICMVERPVPIDVNTDAIPVAMIEVGPASKD